MKKIKNKRSEQIKLSERDFDILINEIENPKEPNDELKKAAKNYKNERGKL